MEYNFGVQLPTQTAILERLQAKALLMIVDAPWYVSNIVIRKDLQIPSVREEICRYSSLHNTRLRTHPNNLAARLTDPPYLRRL
jgi:hypothetical protein